MSGGNNYLGAAGGVVSFQNILINYTIIQFSRPEYFCQEPSYKTSSHLVPPPPNPNVKASYLSVKNMDKRGAI